MSDLAKAYEPSPVEKKWYPFWEKEGFFKADAHSSKPAYSICIPPPNVTGSLHMGHALVNTLQDVLIRAKRMQGFETLWIPGTDHAGIATQTVVERDQIARHGKRRADFSREEFLALIWQWKDKSEERIIEQIKRLGCSCDWSHLAFTMDEKRSSAVRILFKQLFDEGLIYRGDYLVNWDPVTQTALADDEVEHEEKESYLWHMRYPVEGEESFIIVATTRPETMLGDTAVAVNPNDERYKSLIGKQVRLPFVDRLIPIIADAFVDPSFGSGAVKVTPAHDPNDYQMGLRHNLSMINIMTPDGKINEIHSAFSGLSMEEARFVIAEKMKEKKLLLKVEPHKHRVGVSYRSKAVIEPYLSKQWFVQMGPFKEKLIAAVREGKVKLVPSEWESTYFHWIENLRDWCISRQLVWGHRIPIWYNKENKEEMLCFAEEGLPPEAQENPSKWVQDEDVLDGWFSSGLWPFSTLGWPEKTADFAKFYPNSTLITGHDIIFFWVSRMLLMGEYATGKLPFPETFLHGLIYGKSYWRMRKDGGIAYLSLEERLQYDLGEPPPPDVHSKWEKMSKSKGNIIDPIDIIDTYGTDAMRIALISVTTHARQIDLDRRRFEEFKNFINKIWNGARFVFMHVEDLTVEQLVKGLDKALFTLEDKWILLKLSLCIEEITLALTQYTFDKIAERIYSFFWDEFCAYYLELVKPILSKKTGTFEERLNKQRILCVVLCSSLRLFHPVIPFITEELFSHLQALFKTDAKSKEAYVAETLTALSSSACMVSPYPTVLEKENQKEILEDFAFMDKIVYTARNIRAEMQLPPHMKTELILDAPAEDKALLFVKKNEAMLFALLPLSGIKYGKNHKEKGFYAESFLHTLNLIIPLPEEMRLKEKARLEKLKEKLIVQENQMRLKLSNQDFLQKAPPPLVEECRQTLSFIEKELCEVAKKIETF